MDSLTQLMQAKHAQDVIRGELIRQLRGVDGLPEEIRALLIADENATEALRDAVVQHNTMEAA